MFALVSGAAIGFAVAAPVGPIGLLCIRTSLQNGPRAGFAAGLGAALADALYAAVSVFAVGIITHVVSAFSRPLHVAGGLVIIALGVRSMLQRLPSQSAASSAVHMHIFRTTLLLTLANPATMLSFLGIAAGATAAMHAVSPIDGSLLVAGVFCGSAAGWLVLSAAVGSLRRAISAPAIIFVARASGAVLCALGALSIYEASSPPR